MWAAVAAVALVAGAWFVLAFLDANQTLGDLLAQVRETRPAAIGGGPVDSRAPEAGEVITALADRLAVVLFTPPDQFRRPCDLSDVALLVNARRTAEELSSR